MKIAGGHDIPSTYEKIVYNIIDNRFVLTEDV